jgi:GntR family transcriptional regulator / MocR family aminotransferase
MKRAATLPPLALELDRDCGTPLWYQLSVELRAAVARGRLKPGARLPSTRTLARQLRVSRNTVTSAYDDLVSRGLLQGRTGNGSYIAQVPTSRRSGTWFHDPSGNRLALLALP